MLFLLILRTMRFVQSPIAYMEDKAWLGSTMVKMTSGENLLVIVLSMGSDRCPPRS